MSHSILSRLFSFISENDGKVPENQKKITLKEQIVWQMIQKKQCPNYAYFWLTTFSNSQFETTIFQIVAKMLNVSFVSFLITWWGYAWKTGHHTHTRENTFNIYLNSNHIVRMYSASYWIARTTEFPLFRSPLICS